MNIRKRSLSILLLVLSSIFITKPTWSSESIISRQLTGEQTKLLAAKIMESMPERSYYYEDTKFTWVVITEYFGKRAPKDLQDEVVKELQKKYTLYAQINDIPDDLIKKYGGASRYINGFSFSFWTEFEPDAVVKVYCLDWESMFSGNSHWTRYRWTGTDWIIIEQDKPNAKRQYFLNKYKEQIATINSTHYLDINGHIKPKLTVPLTGNKLMEGGDKQTRALSIAEAFLKEEAAILGISDLNDFKRSSGFDGKGNPIIRYTQLLGGLTIAPCGMPGISIVVGSDDSIINLSVDVIPVSTEMRKASSMNTITKDNAVAIVENDLKSQTRVPNLPISYSIKYFSTAAPYIIWHVGVGGGQKSWYYVLNAITGEIVDRRQHAPYGCE